MSMLSACQTLGERRRAQSLQDILRSARQKTHFFREPVLPRLVISGLIINTGAIFSCRHIKNDNNFYLWRLQVIPAPAA
ncbi:MAG: hypothetical protein KZQ60_02785, partial [Candidatus Thiodiazotropha sp. (ex Lucinoma aequizonata)]|nr:hypothetical protein [Candidatus Thiodiazotropha sp. (ex Lucinoma aequizonata)]